MRTAPTVAARRSGDARPARNRRCGPCRRSRPARAGVVPTRLVEPARSPRRRRLAQPRRAGLDDLALDLRHARGRRVRPRREGEDVRARRCRNRRAVAGCSAPSSSVSVGKPAIRSAPIVASGRAALSRSTVATASARLWRRFIRLRIMSSPACSDRWRCGISRGSPAISSNSARRSRCCRARTGAAAAGRGIGGEQPLAQSAPSPPS